MPPYPPCESDGCFSVECCAKEGKYNWPELLGKKGEEAKAIILKDNPSVGVFILIDGASVGITNFCCNRVYVHVDKNGIVSKVPIIG